MYNFLKSFSVSSDVSLDVLTIVKKKAEYQQL